MKVKELHEYILTICYLLLQVGKRWGSRGGSANDMTNIVLMINFYILEIQKHPSRLIVQLKEATDLKKKGPLAHTYPVSLSSSFSLPLDALYF